MTIDIPAEFFYSQLSQNNLKTIQIKWEIKKAVDERPKGTTKASVFDTLSKQKISGTFLTRENIQYIYYHMKSTK